MSHTLGQPTHGISVTLLRPLADLLAQLDVDLDPAAFLSALGVEADTAADAYVDGALVDRELARVAALRGDPAFALTLARASLGKPLGLFGHLVWLSGTLRDALARAAKFYKIITRRSTLSLEEPPGAQIAMVRQHPLEGVTPGRILTELPFASLALRARSATAGRFALRTVHFSHASDAHPTPPMYREVFGAPVVFGAAFSEIAFDASLLDLRLATADPITSAALEAKATSQLTHETPNRSALLDQVRRASMNVTGAPSLEEIAQKLGMSARTLRRHLEHERTTLREVVDDVRRERADELLTRGMSVKEVAFALGFSEPSAFSRAYKRWTGRAPSPR